MKLKPYPEYKNSGVEWLGHVPAEWEIKPLKYIASVNDDVLSELTEPDEEIEYVDIGSVSIDKGIESTDIIKFSEAPSRARRKVQNGDVIVSTVRTYLKAIAPINNPPSNLVCSTGFAVIRPNWKLNPSYAKYSMQAGYFIDEVIARSVGVSYPAINSSDMMCIKITAPSIHDQSIISVFLDHETRKLDTLIAKQEHLIELLQEKRQAIISHAVTKGLNPDAKMKDSGVEWLGMVPENWKVRRLKFNLGLLNEKAERRDFSIGLENIEGWSGKLLKTDTEFEGDGIAFNEGDILFGKLRPYLAKVYLAECSGEAVGDFHVMRPRKGIVSRFAQYQMLNREFISIVDGSTYGAKMPRASWDFIGGMMVTAPPEVEQAAISSYLDDQTTRIDTLVKKAKLTIGLAKEHRVALISAAVTGKIDVREAA